MLCTTIPVARDIIIFLLQLLCYELSVSIVSESEMSSNNRAFIDLLRTST